jgi:hypothetical protein
LLSFQSPASMVFRLTWKSPHFYHQPDMQYLKQEEWYGFWKLVHILVLSSQNSLVYYFLCVQWSRWLSWRYI